MPQPALPTGPTGPVVPLVVSSPVEVVPSPLVLVEGSTDPVEEPLASPVVEPLMVGPLVVGASLVGAAPVIASVEAAVPVVVPSVLPVSLAPAVLVSLLPEQPANATTIQAARAAIRRNESIADTTTPAASSLTDPQRL